jgi:hypothetical protein
MRALDTTEDFLAITDHLQTVTILRPGSSFSVVLEALRTSTYARTERSKLGRHEQHDAIWHLPITTPDVPPELGDQILDIHGSRWTILSFRRSIDGARWRVITRDMAAAHRLNEFIDIDQATFELDDRGNETPVWHPWQTGLPARLELEAVELQRDKEPIGTTRQMVIHLSEPLSLDHTHRVRHPDGRTFQILRCRRKQEVGATFQVEVEEIVIQEEDA